MNRPSDGPFRPLRSPIFICLSLAVAALAVYSPVRHYGFVDYDDAGYFFTNPHVRAGLTWSCIQWAFTSGEQTNWHPLTWLSLMLDVTLFGQGAAAPHVTNVLLHAANCVLLFLFLLRSTSKRWCSAAVALLFAIHPLHVESVAWISERKDVLSGFFGLLSLLCYTQYAALHKDFTVSPPACYRSPLYWFALFFFACGLISKPMLVTLPLVMLLLDYWPLERFTRESFLRLLPEKIPFFVLSAASSAITFIVQQKGGAVTTFSFLPLASRVENAFVSYSRYLAKIFWPFNLAAPYPYPAHWPALLVIFCIALFGSLCLAAVLAGKKNPWLFTGWFWFVGMLIPVIGLVQVGMPAMADRYMYLPIIGILIVFVWGADKILAQGPVPRSWLVILAAVLFLACGWRARNQVAVWENDGTLFGHAAGVTKNNYIACLKMAYWCSQGGRDQEALSYYDETLEMSNDLIALTFSRQEDLQATFNQYYHDLRLDLTTTEFYNLGNSFARLGHWNDAVREYRRALQIKPDQPDVLDNLGFALVEEKQYSGAITNFQAALKLKPDSIGAHNNLASVLYMQDRYQEAAQQFQTVLQLAPDNESFCVNLAETYLRLSETNQAVEYYRRALKLRPDDSRVLAQLRKLGVNAN